MRQEFIRRQLAQRAAVGADASSIALAIHHAVGTLLAELEPLVGWQAVHALYARCLRQTRAAYPLLPPPSVLPRDELLAELQAGLAASDATAARAAGEQLLNQFSNLLASLIGEPLTQRLLDAAWGHPTSESTLQESAP